MEPSSRSCGSKRKQEESEPTGPWRCEVGDVSTVCESEVHALLNDKNHKSKDKFFCGLCDVECNSIVIFTRHCNGKKHKAKESKKDQEAGCDEVQIKKKSEEEQFYCEICDVRCNSKDTMSTHLNGKKHKARKSKKNEIAGDPEENREEEKGLCCEICNVSCNGKKAMENHLTGRKHKSRVALIRICKEGKEEEGNAMNDEDGNGPEGQISTNEAMIEVDEEKKNELWCLICKVKCNSQATIAKHLRGAEHMEQRRRKLMNGMVEKEAKEQ